VSEHDYASGAQERVDPGMPAETPQSLGAGSPHDELDLQLDCSAVLADVWMMLDGECDDSTRARLQHHIENCSPCIEAYGLEEKLKRLLSRKCGGERAPESLRQRLTLEYRQVTIVETRTES
jgi:mycothiol system anti-sigma-R factor